MIRSPKARSANPHLEHLEGRDLPSFLLGTFFALFNGNPNPAPFGDTPLQQLISQLGSRNADMQSAKDDLGVRFGELTGIMNSPAPSAVSGFGGTFALAATDFQRMFADRNAIDALAQADQAFIAGAAAAEAMNGDNLDQLILAFGPMFGVNITAPFVAAQAQGDAAFQDSAVASMVSTDIRATFVFGTFPATVEFGSIAATLPIG
jgi:hypothetical protein